MTEVLTQDNLAEVMEIARFATMGFCLWAAMAIAYVGVCEYMSNDNPDEE